MINVIFDMDGTLIDSAKAIVCAVNEIRADLNLEPLKRDFILDTINTPGQNYAKIFYGVDTYSHTSFKEGYEKYFIKHYDQSVVLFDGVVEVLDFCKKNGCYLAIATNAPQESLVPILKKQNILSYFDKILGVSYGIEAKPDPMMLRLIADEAKYNKSLFIGDSLKDRLCAKNANVDYIHIAWHKEVKEPDEANDKNTLIEKIQTHMKG
ncbi:HAD family hydrolase [Campylobacter sp. 2014D-0216]|uniref:HAD family hydrolase n=1 Tax=Campylobacter sp. 2014D-0216 TaxID=1813595 RepID=UPI0018A4EC32|nr:HAD family hydrolase [Campylobacter sp. 2014D-0216]QOR00465.1 HAD family hydrolase [Campylobacter sp. 2014D-0216]